MATRELTPTQNESQPGTMSASAVLPGSTDRTHYPNFDWLRLAFAMQVVAIHSGIAPHILIQPVAAFLAISGFVVLGSIERVRAKSFFINRALRVLPLLLVSFAFVYFRYDAAELLRTIRYWVWPFEAQEPVNAVVWTLMFEEFFYLTLVVLFAAKFYTNFAAPLILAASISILLANGLFFGIPSTFFLLGASFFLGNAAYLLRRHISRINKWLALALFVIATAIMWRLPYTAVVSPGDTIETYASIGAMLLFAIAGPRLPRLPFDFSYSLYLVHLLVRQELFGVVPFGFPMFAAIIAISTPICAISWYLVERPALRFRRRARDRVSSAAVPVSPSEAHGKTVMERRRGLVVTLGLGLVVGAALGTVVGYFAYSTSSGGGGAGDLPLYLRTIWSHRDGALWTGLGAILGVIWGYLRSGR